MKAIALLLPLLIASPFFAQDNEEEILASKAKEMRIDVFYASKDSSTNEVTQGERVSGYKSKTYIKYNKKGDEVERYYDYDNGTFYLAYFSTYTKGLLDTLSSHIRVLDPPNSWTVYAYDKKKRVISVRRIDDDLRERSKEEMTYDSKGNVLQRTSYYWGEVEVITKYSYDSKGNKTEEVNSYPSQNNSKTRVVFTYDSNGNLISDAYQDSHSDWTVASEYKYDDENHCIEKCVSKKSEPCKVSGTWTYDEHGNVVAQKILANDENLNEYWRIHQMEYEYDAKGNWTKKTIYYDGDPVKIIIRTITY